MAEYQHRQGSCDYFKPCWEFWQPWLEETESGSETVTQRGAALLGPILETVRLEGRKRHHTASSVTLHSKDTGSVVLG